MNNIPVLNLDDDTKELLYCLDRGLPVPPSLLERIRERLGMVDPIIERPVPVQ